MPSKRQASSSAARKKRRLASRVGWARGGNARGTRKPPLGQHFLRDAAVLDRILAAVPNDGLPLIEIGAGDGTLTLPLAELGRPLTAVEYDNRLARPTARALAGHPNARLIEGDILDLSPAQLLVGNHALPGVSLGVAPPYGLVGNLPYAITAPIFRRFLSQPQHRPCWMLVMVQHEVALQVVAPPGKRSLLSLSVQLYATPQLLFQVDRTAFEPPPQVRSAVLFIPLRDGPAVDIPSEARFFEVARAAFRMPRKQLRNALSLGFAMPASQAEAWLNSCAIDFTRRPGTLAIDEWAALAWARERDGAPLPPTCPRHDEASQNNAVEDDDVEDAQP